MAASVGAGSGVSIGADPGVSVTTASVGAGSGVSVGVDPGVSVTTASAGAGSGVSIGADPGVSVTTASAGAGSGVSVGVDVKVGKSPKLKDTHISTTSTMAPMSQPSQVWRLWVGIASVIGLTSAGSPDEGRRAGAGFTSFCTDFCTEPDSALLVVGACA